MNKQKKKVFISTFPFGRIDKEPLAVLRRQGYEVVENPLGRKLTEGETAKLAKSCHAIIAGTENLQPLVETSKTLQMISRVGIGLDSVPLNLCKIKNIMVTYTPDAVTDAVVELTIGLMIDALRKVSFCDREIRKAGWSRPIGLSLGCATIGLLGFGRVGQGVAQRLSGFKPKKILVVDIKEKEKEISRLNELYGLNIEQVELNTLIENSDCLSIHVPLNLETKGLVSKEFLQKMKNSASLVNTARGPIVNEAALALALKQKEIQSAAIDVFSKEPYEGILTNLDNITLTQHIGSCTFWARSQMEYGAAKAVVDFFNRSTLQNQVPEEDYEASAR